MNTCDHFNPIMAIKCSRPAGHTVGFHKGGTPKHTFVWEYDESGWSRYATKTRRRLAKVPIYER